MDSDDYEDERNTADAVNENGNMKIKSLPCIGSNIFGFLSHRQVNDQRQNKSNSSKAERWLKMLQILSFPFGVAIALV